MCLESLEHHFKLPHKVLGKQEAVMLWCKYHMIQEFTAFLAKDSQHTMKENNLIFSSEHVSLNVLFR